MQRVKVQVEPTRSAATTAMLNSKTTPQAARSCGIRHKNFCVQASLLRHQITWLGKQLEPASNLYASQPDGKKPLMSRNISH